MEKERDRIQLSRNPHHEQQESSYQTDMPPMQRKEPSLGDDTPDQFSNGAVQLKANADATTLPPMQRKEAGKVPGLEAGASIQRKTGNGVAQSGGNGGGNGLPGEVQAKMESAMGADFSNVQFKENSSKASSVGALAYAQGNEVHFAPGQFSPNTPKGQELIGHELAHVVQQRQGRVQANTSVSGMAVNDDKGLEAEADQMGAKAAQMKVDASASISGNNNVSSSAAVPQMKLDPKIFSKTTAEQNEGTDKEEEGGSEGPEGAVEKGWAVTKGFENPDNAKESKKKKQKEADRGGAGAVTGMDGNLALGGFSDLEDSKGKDKESSNAETQGPETENEETNANTGINAEQTQQPEAQDQPKVPGMENAEAKQEGESEEEEKEEASEDKEKDKEKDDKPEENEDEEGEGEGEGVDSPKAAVKDKVKGAKGGKSENGGKGGKSGGKSAAPAGNGGSGKVGGGLKPLPVPPAVKGSLGEGQEPDLMLVNKAALGEFGNDRILKDNGDGTYIVLSGTPSGKDGSSGAPMQLIGDPTKDKPKKTKLPKGKAREAAKGNRAKVQASVADFESQAKAEISQLESLKSTISGEVNSGANSARSLVQSAAATERANIEAGFEAQKQALLADSSRVKGETTAALEEAKLAISTAAATAKANVEAEFQLQDGNFVALETEKKAAFSQALVDGKDAMIKIGDEMAAEATKIGEEKAKFYEAKPIPSQTWDEDLLNGGDYEKDRHDARVKAARDTAKTMADEFKKKAQEEGEKLKSAGEAELLQYVSNSVKTSRDAIKGRKEAALQEIQAAETGALQSLQANHDATINSIEAATQGGLQALEQQRVQAIGQIDATEMGKLAAVDQVASEKVQNLSAQVDASIQAMTNVMNQTITGVTQRKNPNAKTVQKQLAQALEGVRAGVAEAKEVASGGSQATVGGLMDTAAQAAAEMSSSAQSAIQGAQQTEQAIVQSLEQQRDGYKEAAKSTQEAATKGITESETTAKADMLDQFNVVKTDIDGTLGKLTSKLAENATGFKGNLQTELNTLPQKIDEQAQKAYDAVKPRWASVLLFVVDLVVVILITAAVIIAFATGGILVALAVGLVAGAIGGAIKYATRVAVTSEEWEWSKFGLETFNGAIDGLNIAVGVVAGPVAQIATAAASGGVKYLAEVGFTDKEFSWSGLGGAILVGTIEGAIGAIGGKAGDGVSDFLTKKIGKEVGEEIVLNLGQKIFVQAGKSATEATFDTLGGGVTAIVSNFVETGTWDWSKLTDELTLENFATNMATGMATDMVSGKVEERFPAPKTNDSSSSGDSNGSGESNQSGDNTQTNANTNANPNDADVNGPDPQTQNQQNSADTEQQNQQQSTTQDSQQNDSQQNNTPEPQNQQQNDNPAPQNQQQNTTPDPQGQQENNTPAPQNQQQNTQQNDSQQNQQENQQQNQQQNQQTTQDGNGSDPKTSKGKQQAKDLGYPDAPEGYHWVGHESGTPFLRRNPGKASEIPPVSYDAKTGKFSPTTEAPAGYHWQYENGKFTLNRNPNMADSLPKIEYDPVTGGFRDAETGAPYSGDLTSVAVRGTDFDGFQASVKGMDPQTAKQAYELFAQKKWGELEALFNEKGLNDKWPPNRGFVSVSNGEMAPGFKFDRFGGWNDKDSGDFKDKGTFVAPAGASFESRALPENTKEKPYNTYEVLKPIPVKQGEAIPWFGQEGGGMQYELPMSIDDLIAQGYIKRVDVTPKGDGTETHLAANGVQEDHQSISDKVSDSKVFNTGGENGDQKVLDEAGFRALAADYEARTKSIEGVEINVDGIAAIKAHFSRDFFSNQTQSGSFANNDVMLSRLEKIMRGELEASPTDLYFYTHEVGEAEIMNDLIKGKGMAESEAYQLAHAIICKQYGITGAMERSNPFYTPEAMKAWEVQMNKEF